ncbi:MAG: diadenylate cyclase [Cellvibrionaceae bacterium]|jgi:diadenylate cyclase
MTSFLNQLLETIQFRFKLINIFDLFDLLLVGLVYFIIFNLIRRSRAAPLLRGVITLLALLILTSLLLPLPTLDWLVSGLMIALLIAVPITLQPELRQWLEGIGRDRFGRRYQRQLASQVSPILQKVIEHCGHHQTGALIVLEGTDPLDDILQTGIPIEGKLSAELLNTIFFDKTALHDGAVILRNGDILAAGCILPLTQQKPDPGYRRVGTRHRAALGVADMSDALAIVVSEETGHMSIAHKGELKVRQDPSNLQQILSDFYLKIDTKKSRSEKKSFKQWVNEGKNTLLYAGISLLLAVLTWGATIERLNPTQEVIISDVALQVANLGSNHVLTNAIPQTVSISIRTTQELADTLNKDSFKATVDLLAAQSGLNRLPIMVSATIQNADILSIQPAQVDLEIATVVSKVLPISTKISEEESLSAVYELINKPKLAPEMISVRGSELLVQQITKVEAAISVANVTQTIKRSVTLVALDDQNNVVNGVILDPAEVQVELGIQRRQDVREIAVNAITSGTPVSGYWLSGIKVEPTSVTLIGDPDLLNSLGGFINTVPIDISMAYGLLELSVPLDIPAEIEVVQNNGDRLNHVSIEVIVTPLQGSLLIERPIQLLNGDGITTTLSLSSVEILLEGSVIALREIELEPELVTVVIDVAELEPGPQSQVTPVIILPKQVKYQLIQSSVFVTIE